MNQSTLLEKLNNVLKAVPSRPTLPILSHVLLTIKDGKCTIAGCDLETFIIETLDTNNKKSFSCCPPAKLLTDLVSILDGDVELTLKKNNLLVNGEDTKIKVMGDTEFPQLPELPNNEPIEIKSSELVYIIDKTIYACSTDEVRQNLLGVHFSFGDSVIASAADGFRSAYCEYQFQADLPEVLIPMPFLKNLSSALRNKDATVKIWTTDTQALFAFGNTIMVSQLILATFPDIKRLTPKEHKAKATLDTAELKRAIKKLLVFIPRTDDARLIQCEFINNGVTLYVNTQDIGECEETVNGEFEGEPYTTAFNGDYMIDALMTVGKQVTIDQNGSSSAFVIYTTGKRETEYGLLMPLFVKEKSQETS